MVKKERLKGSCPARKNNMVAKNDKIRLGLAEAII